MRSSALHNAVARLREAAVDAAWRQWNAIFTLARARRPAQGIVDPEALLVFSMWLRPHEPRVWSAATVWASVAPRLLSVQRTKNIVKVFPADVTSSLDEFAHTAVSRGGDARWRSVVSGSPVMSPPHRTESASPRFGTPAALMLRIRLALGIGIKSDVLSYLVGCVGAAATVQEIADATYYYGRAVRRAVEELAAGGFVRARSTVPASYAADLEAWARLLDFDTDNPPAWHSWVNLYGFVVRLCEWLPTLDDAAPVVTASEARDLLAEWAPKLDALQALAPRPGTHPGEEFLKYFEGQILAALTDYVASAV